MKRSNKARKATIRPQPEVASLAGALLPLASLCIKSGHGVGHLVMAAKLASISVASENARIGNRLNHSRIAAITGLTRKEVRSLTRVSEESASSPVSQSHEQRTVRVIEGWRTDPAYLTDSGAPAALTVRGQQAGFPQLVRRYGGDVTPVAVLKELQRLGVVSKTRSNTVRLLRSSLRLPTMGSDQIANFAERMRTIGQVLMKELDSTEQGSARVFETAKELSPGESALFVSLFSERAADLIDGADRWYQGTTGSSGKRKSAKVSEKTQKVVLRVIVSSE